MPEEMNTETTVESTEQTEPTVETTEPNETVQEEQTTPSLLDEFSYQYNKEDVKPESIDELRELAEMGRYYKDKGKTHVDFLKSQAKKYNMSTEDYISAVAEQEQASEVQKIAEAENVSVEVAKKLFKAEQLEKQVVEGKKSEAQKAKEKSDLELFSTQFPDVEASEVTKEMWKEWNQGDNRLVDIWTRHENATLKEQLAKLTEQKEIQNRNAENAEVSTGSVTGNGAVGSSELTLASIDKMTPKELMKRWKEVKKVSGMK